MIPLLRGIQFIATEVEWWVGLLFNGFCLMVSVLTRGESSGVGTTIDLTTENYFKKIINKVNMVLSQL